MEDMLKKLDEVIARTGASYGEAYEVLMKNDGDVIRSIVAIEKERRPKNYFGIHQMVEKTKDTKIQIKKDEELIGEIPAAAGILGVVATCFMPRFALVGAVSGVAAMLNHVNLEVMPHGGVGKRERGLQENDHSFVKELADLAEQNGIQGSNPY